MLAVPRSVPATSIVPLHSRELGDLDFALRILVIRVHSTWRSAPRRPPVGITSRLSRRTQLIPRAIGPLDLPGDIWCRIWDICGREPRCSRFFGTIRVRKSSFLERKSREVYDLTRSGRATSFASLPAMPSQPRGHGTSYCSRLVDDVLWAMGRTRSCSLRQRTPSYALLVL